MHYNSAKRGYFIWRESTLLFGQEPSFYAIPGLRYEAKYKLHSIIGTVHYLMELLQLPPIFEQISPKVATRSCLLHIDDILVTGRSDDVHLEHLKAVFQSLRTKRTKCWFFQDSVEYLGRVVSKEGIQTSKRKIEAILKVKPQTNQQDLKSFLGMVN